MKKNQLIIISVLAAVLVAAVAVTLVLTLGGEKEPPVIVWVDGVTPEEQVDPEVTTTVVTYPEKPAAPAVADSSKPVSVGELTASDSCYLLSESEMGISVSYNSAEKLPNFAYIYVPISNYQAKYAYFKVKANCTGVERLAIVAVYYEQYDLGRPGATIYNSAVTEGENTFVCDLNEAVLLDEHYENAMGEKLTQKTICGFMLMIDSNPKQVIDNFTGEMLITEVAVVDETDEDLAVLYKPPFVGNWTVGESYTEHEIYQYASENTDSSNVIIDYAFTTGYPYVQTQIYNYKSEYTMLKMKIKGIGVKNVSIAIAYSLTSSANGAPYNFVTYGMRVTEEFDTVEFDFSSLEELSNDYINTIPGSYVKNLRPIALYFFIDTADTTTGGAGTLYVEDVAFEKVVDDGSPRVTSTWTVTGSGMMKSNVTTGGVGTLTYNKTQGWIPVTVNVASYNSEYTKLIIRVKFYGNAKNIGIALAYGSANTVIKSSNGDPIPGIVFNDTAVEGSDEAGSYVFHTYEIEFSQMIATGTVEELLSAQSINSILLYIDSVASDGTDITDGGDIAERCMQFVGIEFVKVV